MNNIEICTALLADRVCFTCHFCITSRKLSLKACAIGKSLISCPECGFCEQWMKASGSSEFQSSLNQLNDIYKEILIVAALKKE